MDDLAERLRNQMLFSVYVTDAEMATGGPIALVVVGAIIAAVVAWFVL